MEEKGDGNKRIRHEKQGDEIYEQLWAGTENKQEEIKKEREGKKRERMEER